VPIFHLSASPAFLTRGKINSMLKRCGNEDVKEEKLELKSSPLQSLISTAHPVSIHHLSSLLIT